MWAQRIAAGEFDENNITQILYSIIDKHDPSNHKYWKEQLKSMIDAEKTLLETRNRIIQQLANQRTANSQNKGGTPFKFTMPK